MASLPAMTGTAPSSVSGEPNSSSSNQLCYEDALDDVHTRFILNLPESELSTSDRLFFQLEQAWWYYEDWICDVYPERNLPRYPAFKNFAKMMFEYSPILPSSSKFHSMWIEFSNYKRSISNYGCILLTSDCTEMVLCQLYNSKTLTFPAGKINHGEDGPTAAARETYEETGFDPFCQRGLTSQWKETDPDKITWSIDFVTEKHNMLVHQEDGSSNYNNADSNNNNNNNNATPAKNQQHGTMTSSGGSGGVGKRRICYIVTGVPKDFPFEPVCRKEVSDISWYAVNASIPKPSFGVIPFLPQLKRYINKYMQKSSSTKQQQSSSTSTTTITGSEQQQRDKSNPKNRTTPKKNRSRNNSRGRNNNNDTTGKTDNNNNNNSSRGRGGGGKNNSRGRDSRSRTHRIDSIDDDLVVSGLAKAGDDAGWDVEEMFSVNEKLIGHKSTYDGNPHVFAEQGFHGGIDPHAYRIVGGTLLNQSQSSTASSQEGGSDGGDGDDDEDNNTNVRSLLGEQPRTSRLQALFNSSSNRKEENNEGEIMLKPFFSTDGATPWGEIIEGIVPQSKIETMMNSKKQLQQQPEKKTNKTSKNSNSSNKKKNVNTTNDDNKQQDDNNDEDDVMFLTDVQITNRNKAKKMIGITQNNEGTSRDVSTQQQQRLVELTLQKDNYIKVFDQQWDIYQQQRKQMMDDITNRRKLRQEQYERDMEYIGHWVQQLPKPKPTKYFGTFRLDADAIMKVAEQAIMVASSK